MITISVRPIEHKNPAFVLELNGMLDKAGIAELDRAVQNILQENETPQVLLIFDCEKLIYINSMGITKLMNLYIKMLRCHGQLRLIKVSENILDVLNIVGAAKMMKIYSSLENALE